MILLKNLARKLSDIAGGGSIGMLSEALYLPLLPNMMMQFATFIMLLLELFIAVILIFQHSELPN